MTFPLRLRYCTQDGDVDDATCLLSCPEEVAERFLEVLMRNDLEYTMERL